LDGLIVLLIIIGIISRVSKSNKKKQEAAKKARAKAFADAADAVRNAKKVIEPARRTAQQAVQAVSRELPFTQADWDAFLQCSGQKAAEGVPSPQKPSPEGRASRRQPLPEGVSPALRSTQGESESEHRGHVDRIAAEEKREAESLQARQNLRAANRQKLREAVIMSEILGKPVALRTRR